MISGTTSYLYCTLHNYHITFAPSLSNAIMPGILWFRTKNSEQMAWENNTLRNNMSALIIHYLYGHFFCSQRKWNNTCSKTTHTRMMNRAFSVLVYCTKNIPPLLLNTQTYYTITHYEVQSVSHTKLYQNLQKVYWQHGKIVYILKQTVSITDQCGWNLKLCSKFHRKLLTPNASICEKSDGVCGKSTEVLM